MMRWCLIFIFSWIIFGFSGQTLAEEDQAGDQSRTETPAVTEEDQEMIEAADMLEMMELLEDMEFMEELDLFIEENTDEKED